MLAGILGVTLGLIPLFLAEAPAGFTNQLIVEVKDGVRNELARR